MQKTIRSMLAGGDRRSIGRSEQVAQLVLREPKQIESLFECLWHEDSLVRMRAADAAEKISRNSGALLQPYKKELLGLLAETDQQEVRWHLAVIVPRLQLASSERNRAVEILQTYLADRSSIVKTFAMQGLFDLIEQDSELRPAITEVIRSATRTGTAAMRARGRKLLRRLEADESRK